MAKRVDHQQVVQQLLDTKAVDFGAIGDAFKTMGPSLALMDEPWEGFCGTMRYFVHVYRLTGLNNPVENLGELQNATKELQG